MGMALLNLLWETLVWVYRTSVAVVAWSIAHPIAALVVTLTLRAAGAWLEDQPWAGADLLSQLTYGLADVFMWTALITIVVDTTVTGFVDFIEDLILWVTGKGGSLGATVGAASRMPPGSLFPAVISPFQVY